MERCIQDGENGAQEAQMEGFAQKSMGQGNKNRSMPEDRY